MSIIAKKIIIWLLIPYGYLNLFSNNVAPLILQHSHATNLSLEIEHSVILGSGCEREKRTIVPIHNNTTFPIKILIVPYACRSKQELLEQDEKREIDLGFCGLRSIQARFDDSFIRQAKTIKNSEQLQARYNIDFNDYKNKCGTTGPWEIIAPHPGGYEDLYELKIIKKQ